jgi:hypothetical protein
LLNSSCRCVNCAGTSGSGNVDSTGSLIESRINLRCGEIVFGIVESEVVSSGCTVVLGRSNISLAFSDRNLGSLEGKSGALLVELS